MTEHAKLKFDAGLALQRRLSKMQSTWNCTWVHSQVINVRSTTSNLDYVVLAAD